MCRECLFSASSARVPGQIFVPHFYVAHIFVRKSSNFLNLSVITISFSGMWRFFGYLFYMNIFASYLLYKFRWKITNGYFIDHLQIFLHQEWSLFTNQLSSPSSHFHNRRRNYNSLLRHVCKFYETNGICSL